jgi:hypothetical protein
MGSQGEAVQMPRLSFIIDMVGVQYCLKFLPLLLCILWGQCLQWPTGVQPTPSPSHKILQQLPLT